MMAALRWANPLTWVVDWPAWALVLAKASVWLLLVWVALACLRGRHPRFRALMCRGAVASLALLCVLTVYVPRYELGVVRPAYAPPAPLETADTATAGADATRVSPTPVAPSPPRRASWTAYVPSMDSIALVLWAAVAVAMLMRLAGKMRAAGQLAGLGTPADEATMATLRRLARQAGARRAPRLRVTDAVAGPMLAGLLRPTILLPRTQDETGDRAGLSNILAHELAHVRTHDLWWNVALEALCCVLWFHPAAWRMARIHETACEEACDADAVRLDGNADGYRRTLARLALDMAGVRPGLAIPMARPAHIARRVRALANPVGRFRAQWRRAVTPGLVVLALMTAFAGLSCYRRGPKGLYERASGTTGKSFTLKPTTFTLDAVARWNRDGSVRVEDGKGAPAEWDGPLRDHSGLTPFVDTVEIKIGPDEDVFDVTDVRIFDHATQRMLGFNDDRSVGFGMDGHVVRVSCLGEPMPNELDVWLRVRHRPKGDPLWVLKPEAGAQATVDGFTVRLREIVGDVKGYRFGQSTERPSDVVWHGAGDDEHVSHVVVDLLDPGNVARGDRFQLCVVDDHGKRLFAGPFLSLRNGVTHLHRFAIEPERIQSLEVCPFHEGNRFYFEQVRAPQADAGSFAPPPALEFETGGKEGMWTSDFLGMRSVELTVSRGRLYGGMCAPVGGDPYFTRAEKPSPDGTTIAVSVKALNLPNLTKQALNASGEELENSSGDSASLNGYPGTIKYWQIDPAPKDIARVRLAFEEDES